MTDPKPLSVAQQRERRENCKQCGGEGYIAGHDPMKICDCIERTDHSRYPHKAPEGTRENNWGMPVATAAKNAAPTSRLPSTKAKADRDEQNARNYGYGAQG